MLFNLYNLRSSAKALWTLLMNKEFSSTKNYWDPYQFSSTSNSNRHWKSVKSTYWAMTKVSYYYFL